MDKTVTIPQPRPTQGIYRGFTGVQTRDTFPVSIRWTADDREYTDRQAKLLGVTFSEFVRWCTMKTAQELSRARVAATYEAPKAKPKIDMSEYE